VITLAEGERKEYSGSKLLSTEMPRVEGVAVVCAGGGDPNVRAELTELLTSLLGIGSHRVHISRRK
jgi:stage III sporulation protein AG